MPIGRETPRWKHCGGSPTEMLSLVDMSRCLSSVFGQHVEQWFAEKGSWQESLLGSSSSEEGVVESNARGAFGLTLFRSFGRVKTTNSQLNSDYSRQAAECRCREVVVVVAGVVVAVASNVVGPLRCLSECHSLSASY
jgi:hypothetical protein